VIPVRGFEGKTVAVFGLARTGLAAARALTAGGANVALWDESEKGRAAADAEGLPLVDLSKAEWRGFSALVLSPGVPLTHPKPHWVVEKAKAAGVEIIGDIELLARTIAQAPPHKRPKIAIITGTNGKSTTTALLGHLLTAAGRDARIGGNIGVGVLGLDDMHGGAVYVIEAASYQLDLTSSLKPEVAVLLNISPDHLDRHGGMDGYIAAKKRVFHNQGEGDTAIIGVDDPWSQQICTEITSAGNATVWPVSSGRAMGRGVYALQGVLYDATTSRVVEVADLLRAQGLPGKHNWQNAAAAYAAARGLGVSMDDAAGGLVSFPGLAHRMETIAQVGQVKFVNDSKATNADAARQAMSTYPKFYWIAGGRPKAGGIDGLEDLFPRISKAYLIGEAANEFAGRLGPETPISLNGNIEAAVAAAYKDARASSEEAVVLFSPACASFDQFPDFEARGEAFRDAVNEIARARGKES
jgi:UDP-N-acetylmuramoylalanine--D-glutamate ligase